MTLQILSDIHLEFGLRKFELPASDGVILAGDIHVGSLAIDWIREHIPPPTPVIYILGNHEFYYGSYPLQVQLLQHETAHTHIHVLENESFQMGSITFHGCTLWTDFDLFGTPELTRRECQYRMNDYRLIHAGSSETIIQPQQIAQSHHQSVNWLHKSLQNSPTCQNVVITHHAPSRLSVPESLRSDPIAAAYASDLETLIQEQQPALWIHGHLHQACDYAIANTRVLSNPAGYPHQDNTGFCNPLLVTL